MFDWVTDFFLGLCGVISTVAEWMLNLPAAIVNALIDLWYLLKDETLNALGNLLWDSFSVLANLSPWNFNVDQELLNSIYVNANLFFPVDDLIAIAIFLLETWVMVKVAKYSVFLALTFFKPRKPNLSVGSGE